MLRNHCLSSVLQLAAGSREMLVACRVPDAAGPRGSDAAQGHAQEHGNRNTTHWNICSRQSSYLQPHVSCIKVHAQRVGTGWVDGVHTKHEEVALISEQ